MLKQVNLPLGAHFTIDYEQTQNSFDMPHRQWKMTAVEMHDNHPGDGADVVRAEVEYGDGYYDRYERTFYGFEKVTIKEIDTENSNAVYRTTEQNFENRNFYTQGILTSSSVKDGEGNIYTTTENEYKYRAKIVENNKIVDLFEDFEEDDLKYSKADISVYPHLTATTNRFFEGESEAQKSYKNEFSYDDYGNVTEYRDLGDAANGDKPIVGVVEYHKLTSLHSFNVPKSITVSSEGVEYRKRETEVNSKGQISKVIHTTDEGKYAEVDLEYTSYGTIEKKTMPANYKGERMWYKYAYDKNTHSFVTNVEDAFGYSSSTAYDYKIGVPIQTIDLNNNPMKFDYDTKGRLTAVHGPKEIAAGAPFTIRHSYAPFDEIAYGTTEHYDATNPDDYIQTAIFADPLGRVLQTKKDATIVENENISLKDKDEPKGIDVMTVSGKVIYDAFGRVTESYYPTTEPLGNALTFNKEIDDVSPTKVVYDILDREVTTTLPDQTVITNSYGFDRDHTQTLQFVTTITDPMGNSTKSFATARGWQTATLMPDDIWLKTRYDHIGQPIEVEDHDGNITKNKYDKIGRRTERNHPDAGISKWSYDNVGNITAYHPEHIDRPIEYEYEYSRLTKIKYPDNPHNNVTYEYGAPKAEHNRAGRVEKQIDATGAQLFSYGNMGEITENLRTIVVPDNGKFSFLTTWEYDSWNRLMKMHYPDGEELTYSYDTGGNMTTMKAEKGSHKYSYVNQILYDKFGNRKYIAYGNGTTTTYSYDHANLRMTNLQTVTAGGRLIQNNHYEYDAVGNILSLNNDAEITEHETLYGGPTTNRYSYDNRYQLISAEGTHQGFDKQHKYNLTMEYGATGKILRKTQNNQWRKADGDWNSDAETTVDYRYSYDGQKPHAVSSIVDNNTETLHTFTYDASGNNLLETNSKASSDRQMVWTEDNRLASIKARGNISHYLYDANGIRTLKMSSSSFNISVNGVAAGSSAVDGNFTIYANPYAVVRKNQYTKHYFLGTQRILTKIGNSEVEKTFFEGYAENIVPNVDYQGKQDDLENKLVLNNELLNVGWYRETRGRIPSQHIKHYLRSKEYGGQSGVNPWGNEDNSSDNNQSQNAEDKQYYFHPDHLGSTNYLTDVTGEAYQHVAYLPWGEVFVEQRNTQSSRNTFLYTGKELDEETGLYYYEQRYMNPKLSVFLGVDPLLDKFPEWGAYTYTFNNPIRFIDPDGMEGYSINEVFGFQNINKTKEDFIYPNSFQVGLYKTSIILKLFLIGGDNLLEAVMGFVELASDINNAVDYPITPQRSKLLKYSEILNDLNNDLSLEIELLNQEIGELSVELNKLEDKTTVNYKLQEQKFDILVDKQQDLVDQQRVVKNEIGWINELREEIVICQ